MIQDFLSTTPQPEHFMIGGYPIGLVCRFAVFLLVPPVILVLARNRLDFFGRCSLCVGVVSAVLAFVSWVGRDAYATAGFLIAAALGFGLISNQRPSKGPPSTKDG